MTQAPLPENVLFYGDNLNILKEYVADKSVDLIYLDPPFNSSRNYNVLFKDESGRESEAQIQTFEDSWHWNTATQRLYESLVTDAAKLVSDVMSSFSEIIG